MILGSASASICWWSCYHSSQLTVSIKSALTNWTIGSIFHCCISIHSFTIQNAKKKCCLHWRHFIFVFLLQYNSQVITMPASIYNLLVNSLSAKSVLAGEKLVAT
jgi:hypothetical protein